MNIIVPVINYSSSVSLYVQIYDFIRKEIVAGFIKPDERLPSLRLLAKEMALSITTIELAYQQLVVEGYIYAKPQSGYFVSHIVTQPKPEGFSKEQVSAKLAKLQFSLAASIDKSIMMDTSSFDFYKWKKCTTKILTEYSHLLLSEGAPQGEDVLRYQIAKYVYESRSVRCDYEQVVIAAGTQQITNFLCMILAKNDISHAVVEQPGYKPVQNIFADRGFKLLPIPVLHDGIDLNALPVNIRSVAYVTPSNQFPTGSIMPIGKRYEFLEWAKKNNSYIIEDDYDSELRYFGRPIPSLQGLDQEERVIYLGSFSSTLFPAIKISYMILPRVFVSVFQKIAEKYTQTCSKTEQLTLALYMEQGLFQTHIKKLRKTNTQKLRLTISCLQKFFNNKVSPLDNQSGLQLQISIKTQHSADYLCQMARNIGVDMKYLSSKKQSEVVLVFYYAKIPLANIEAVIRVLANQWKL